MGAYTNAAMEKFKAKLNELEKAGGGSRAAHQDQGNDMTSLCPSRNPHMLRCTGCGVAQEAACDMRRRQKR
jgi:hypothetical protein